MPPSSLSAHFCRKKPAHLLICSFDAVHLGRLVHKCAPRSPNWSGPIAVLLSAHRALIRCVSCCMTSQASGVACLFVFVYEGERCSLESTCETQWVTLHHDRLSWQIKGRTQTEAVVRKHHSCYDAPVCSQTDVWMAELAEWGKTTFTLLKFA